MTCITAPIAPRVRGELFLLDFLQLLPCYMGLLLGKLRGD